MRKIIQAAALMSTVFLTTGAHAQTAGSGEHVKIGFIASLSGSLAAIGQDQYDGFMLAVKEEDGKLGGVQVTVLKEDDQLKPDLANQIASRLIDREKVAIITGVSGSNVVVALSKPLSERKVVLVGSNAAPSPIAGKDCSPYFFSTAPQADQKSEVVGQFANDSGFKRVVMLAANYQAGKDMVAGFKRKFKGEVLDEVYTPLDQLDFSIELAQVAAEQPDAIFAFFPGSLGVNFVKQYQQAGLAGTVPLLSTGLVDGVQLPALKKAALGVFGGSFWEPDRDIRANKTFLAGFVKEYGRLPSEYAAQSYDAAKLIAGALGKIGGDVTDRGALVKALEESPFESVRGNFRFNANHMPVNDMHILKVVADDAYGVALKRVATPLSQAGDSYASECRMPRS